MEKLIRGILDFRNNVYPEKRDLFIKLATAQAPDTLFITCSDSRVAPNWFASTDPGDLFVVRNVGNLVPPCSGPGCNADHSVGAAIEFSIRTLNITDIVVCGHSGCGAIRAINGGVDKLPQSGLKDWLRIGETALARTGLDYKISKELSYEDRLSQTSTLQQIESLKTYPLVQEMLKDGKIRLHAWWFEIAMGSVFVFNENTRQFVLIDERAAESLLKRL